MLTRPAAAGLSIFHGRCAVLSQNVQTFNISCQLSQTTINNGPPTTQAERPFISNQVHIYEINIKVLQIIKKQENSVAYWNKDHQILFRHQKAFLNAGILLFNNKYWMQYFVIYFQKHWIAFRERMLQFLNIYHVVFWESRLFSTVQTMIYWIVLSSKVKTAQCKFKLKNYVAE